MGIFFDRKLTFDMNVSYLIENGNTPLVIIKWTKNILNQDCMIILYKTLVRPKLEYNSSILKNLSLTKSNSMEILQRKIITMLYDKCLKKIVV